MATVEQGINLQQNGAATTMEVSTIPSPWTAAASSHAPQHHRHDSYKALWGASSPGKACMDPIERMEPSDSNLMAPGFDGNKLDWITSNYRHEEGKETENYELERSKDTKVKEQCDEGCLSPNSITSSHNSSELVQTGGQDESATAAGAAQQYPHRGLLLGSSPPSSPTSSSSLQQKRFRDVSPPVTNSTAVYPHALDYPLLKKQRATSSTKESLNKEDQANSSEVRPALNTNGRPRAKRGSATDPQSVYARQRRERINERLKILQNLVPNGAKVDIVTMLEEAINYVKFLQLQVKLLNSDEYWMYALTTHNGIDVFFDMLQHSNQ